MKKLNYLFGVLLLGLLTTVFIACSNDDDEGGDGDSKGDGNYEIAKDGAGLIGSKNTKATYLQTSINYPLHLTFSTPHKTYDRTEIQLVFKEDIDKYENDADVTNSFYYIAFFRREVNNEIIDHSLITIPPYGDKKEIFNISVEKLTIYKDSKGTRLLIKNLVFDTSGRLLHKGSNYTVNTTTTYFDIN